jgi:cytochrome c biogenesis protein CcmG, thiol:disulfide interchange protein DsbE
LHALYNGKKYSFSKKIFLRPDTIRTGKLTLALMSNEQVRSRFKYREKKYSIRAKQVSSGQFFTDPRYINIRIDAGKNIPSPEYRQDDVLHLYDTVRRSGNIFVIQSISDFLDKIVLTPISPGSLPLWTNNVRRAAVIGDMDKIKGKSYPYLKYLTDSAGVAGWENKILFINFWFAKCLPCIAEFNSLNRLYDEFKRDSTFKLISFTFESPQEIEKMRKKYSLLFDIYSLPREEINKLSLSNLFPTNIIIDKNGLVDELFIGGETNTNASDLFFENKVLPKIRKLLN